MNEDDLKKLDGLLGFAEGVLQAREKVRTEMVGPVFHEHDFFRAAGIHLDNDDGSWIKIERLRETIAPEPPAHVAPFFDFRRNVPDQEPQISPAISVEVSIDEASDLEECGLLQADDIRTITENGIAVENRVKIILRSSNMPEMRRDFERYLSSSWADWANQEKPVRLSVQLYKGLYSIYQLTRNSEGAAPTELVWGIGIARWETVKARIDLPIIEQLVDIDMEEEGAISVRPRDLPPNLSLKPYIQLDVDGSQQLQHQLQEQLQSLLEGEEELNPFSPFMWEPLLATVANELASDGQHVARQEIVSGEKIPSPSKRLRVTSSWAIFGRPRTNEARVTDLRRLRERINENDVDIPASLKGYAAAPPDEPASDAYDFDLGNATLQGNAVHSSWSETAPRGNGSANSSSGPARVGSNPTKSLHFFPLPFNQEQSRISDLIDDSSIAVACVSGPPGTGKSHSIANIISHQMALGKRVLVTARTPEAIAAVREKLPDSLQPLVVASVGTDRQSTQQLQDAVKELSNKVVTLNIDEAKRERRDLEGKIISCDQAIAEADEKLAIVARGNLEHLDLDGNRVTPMEAVQLLGEREHIHGWFLDRPADYPPAQLNETLERLRSSLPLLAADIMYAGADLPDLSSLPIAQELLDAHRSELEWSRREVVDYSSAPKMAKDSAGSEGVATRVLEELQSLSDIIDGSTKNAKKMAIHALKNAGSLDRSHIVSVRDFLLSFLQPFRCFNQISTVSFQLGPCPIDDFSAAAIRGSSGQKPVGLGLFNSKLKAAVASVRINDEIPSKAAEWAIVVEAVRLQKQRPLIEEKLLSLLSADLIDPVPEMVAELAEFIDETQADIAGALTISDRLKPVSQALLSLFPYGLDVDEQLSQLNLEGAVFALKANLPDDYVSHSAIDRLKAHARDGALPVLRDLKNFADALGKTETNPEDIVSFRNEITQELDRLQKVLPKLAALRTELEQLEAAGAPEWRRLLENNPEAATTLIPDNWVEAWDWGRMKGKVDGIVALGNGDDHRNAKADATRRRQRYFEDLIRLRTLMGLKARMTPSVQQALEAFGQAVAKIGTGKGKKAPRFIRAAREAARQASSAAPVWIMPEYKIPEQLPPIFGDFDLVILDEASQSDITALSALARGKKILVVGDEKQVSPAGVGVSTQKMDGLRAEHLQDLPGKDLMDENASIFEITKRMHPTSHVMLREHFRCVAPIIQFSTRFYNNDLIPLRVPKASERFDPPLCDVFISNASREGNVNEAEAKWIVDEIARLICDPAHAKRDIGVISLISSEQAQKIGRMLVEDDRVGPEKIEERRMIFGDARTMQGQERSVVFLSMVATPKDARAQKRKDDYQRFNVAMSRAQDRLYLVRSVGLEHLKPDDVKADVLHHFRDPMPEGRGSTAEEVRDLLDRCDTDFEREVLKLLIDAKYRVRPQVQAAGFRIDLVVEGAEDRRLAIELDGDQFHGPEVWDQDMIRQAALERAGWVFWRVFGSQWQSNKDFWWKNLQETLSHLGIEPIGATEIDDRFTETILVDAARKLTETTPDALQVSEDVNLTYEPLTPMQQEDVHSERTEISNSDNRQATRETAVSSTHSIDSGDQVPIDLHKESASVDGERKTKPPSEHRLNDAERPGNVGIGGTDASRFTQSESVAIGSTVRLEKFGSNGGKMEVTIVEDGHDVERGLIGKHTPLGQALLDAEVGETIEYRVGAYVQEVEILSITVPRTEGKIWDEDGS